MNGKSLITIAIVATMSLIMIVTIAVKAGNAMHDLMDSGPSIAQQIENLK